MKAPPKMSDNQRRALKLQDIKYVIVKELWWRNIEGILLKCVDEPYSSRIMHEMHSGVCGGHYIAKKIAHKVIRARLWWSALFKGVQKLVKKCDAYQRFTSQLKFSSSFPLRPFEVQASFHQLRIDFIGKITKKSSGGHLQILVAIDYFTKWVEGILTKGSTSKVVMDLIIKNIIIRFGCPNKIVTTNAMCFRSEEYKAFL